jgi:hypothetical protein
MTAILTNAGIAKLTNAIILGQPLTLTHIAIGDGVGQLSAASSALGHECYRMPVSATVGLANNAVNASATVPSSVGGFTAREVALISDTTVIAVANIPATELVASAANHLSIEMAIQLTSELINSITLSPPPDYIPLSQKGSLQGVCPLVNGKVPLARINVNELSQALSIGPNPAPDDNVVFNDLFDGRPLVQRAGGYWDIQQAYSRVGGQKAEHEDDLITVLTNMATKSLGKEATLKNEYSATKKVWPLIFTRQIKYTPDINQPLNCEFRFNVPMLGTSTEAFADLHKANSANTLLNELLFLVADPGLDLKRCPGFTFATVSSAVFEFLIAEGTESTVTLESSVPRVPGVTIHTIDFASLATYNSNNPPAVNPIRRWVNGVEVNQVITQQTPTQALSQFLTANGDVFLSGAGSFCSAAQCVLILSRAINDTEAASINQRMTAAMTRIDPSFVPNAVATITLYTGYVKRVLMIDKSDNMNAYIWDIADTSGNLRDFRLGGSQAITWLSNNANFNTYAEAQTQYNALTTPSTAGYKIVLEYVVSGFEDVTNQVDLISNYTGQVS